MLSTETISCQPSWVLRSSTVSMAITHVGGHMAPVSFYANCPKPVQPYYISPWQCEAHQIPEGRSEWPLRGDFFCLPFGDGPAEDENEQHLPHGQTSGGLWTLVSSEAVGGVERLSIGMDLTVRPGRVIRDFYLVDGQNVVYDRTVINGFDGKTTLGHHAVLALPEMEAVLLVSTSDIHFGLTYPGQFADPARAEYQFLASAAPFDDLTLVPSIFKSSTGADCTRYPTRRGFTDLLQVATEPVAGAPAWTTAVNTEAGYLWFAMRDPQVLPSTIFWIENRGRHNPPWNGRNCSLGLEDVCAFFDKGIKASSETNEFMQKGVKTFHALQSQLPFTVSYIQGVVRVPTNFRRVRAAFLDEASVTFVDETGNEVETTVETGFLYGNPLSTQQ